MQCITTRSAQARLLWVTCRRRHSTLLESCWARSSPASCRHTLRGMPRPWNATANCSPSSAG
eukprot:1559224-Alexandrium_andersonii.AAC.1